MALSIYKSMVRPLAFRLDPERAHALAHWALPILGPLARLRGDRVDPRLATELAGLQLTSPVGLAPGFDKNALSFRPLMRLGFGYVQVGSILMQPRDGNVKPRLLRDVENESLLNALGSPSRGVDFAERNLRRGAGHNGVIVANVIGFDVEEGVELVRRLEPLVDAVEIGLRCPNVVGRRTNTLDPENFEWMVREINQTRTKPLFVKLPSYDHGEREARFELVRLMADLSVDAVTVPGSYARKDSRSPIGTFRISGPPIKERALAFVRDMYGLVGNRMAIKALGGISTGQDAFNAIAAGATCVELFTGAIYEGPMVARRINRELSELLERHDLASVAELRGTGT